MIDHKFDKQKSYQQDKKVQVPNNWQKHQKIIRYIKDQNNQQQENVRKEIQVKQTEQRQDFIIQYDENQQQKIINIPESDKQQENNQYIVLSSENEDSEQEYQFSPLVNNNNIQKSPIQKKEVSSPQQIEKQKETQYNSTSKRKNSIDIQIKEYCNSENLNIQQKEEQRDSINEIHNIGIEKQNEKLTNEKNRQDFPLQEDQRGKLLKLYHKQSAILPKLQTILNEESQQQLKNIKSNQIYSASDNYSSDSYYKNIANNVNNFKNIEQLNKYGKTRSQSNVLNKRNLNIQNDEENEQEIVINIFQNQQVKILCDDERNGNTQQIQQQNPKISSQLNSNQQMLEIDHKFNELEQKVLALFKEKVDPYFQFQQHTRNSLRYLAHIFSYNYEKVYQHIKMFPKQYRMLIITFNDL